MVFCIGVSWHEVSKSTLGTDVCLCEGTPAFDQVPQTVCQYPSKLLGGERHCAHKHSDLVGS